MKNHGNLKTDFKAVYYDGKSPLRHEVVITITREGLKIEKQDKTSIWWPFEEINQTNDIYSEKEIKLEKGKDTPEILLIKDLSFIHTLKHISPNYRKNFSPVASNTKWLRYVLSILIGSILTVVISYKWLIPALTDLVVSIIPISWEQKLGKNYMDYFLEVYAVCDDEMLTEKIDHIKDKLVSTLDNTGYEYRVTILDSPVVNAFALPGGDFVIFNGLIKKSTRPEELAGVMAHEIQHIEQRHTTKLLVKDKLFEFILTSGEGSSQGVESTLQIARVLGGLAYRRAEESAADAQGLKMLIEAQIDPNGMKDFFKIMEAEYGKMPALFKYISTHPDVGERIETLDTMIRRSSFTPKKLLADVDWDKTKMLCKKTKKPSDVKINGKDK